ncbi:MAG TPA: hypothetical protein VEB64_10365 [Azospirillaceae bacterium]|nr:hypothetical protein [Azospirillaceae bacterium]
MILTPIPADDTAGALERFAAKLAHHSLALKVLRRIAASWPVTGEVDTPEQRSQGVRLAHAFGIGTLDEEPMRAFMWDGKVIRTRIEASVIVHEVAHWLCCPPERRAALDFGLGAGPETGRMAEAEAALSTDENTRQEEECLTSLLGILWEAELGHPAILAFLEQNWLESIDRPSAIGYFTRMVDRLLADGLIDTDGRPVGPDIKLKASQER